MHMLLTTLSDKQYKSRTENNKLYIDSRARLLIKRTICHINKIYNNDLQISLDDPIFNIYVDHKNERYCYRLTASKNPIASLAESLPSSPFTNKFGIGFGSAIAYIIGVPMVYSSFRDGLVGHLYRDIANVGRSKDQFLMNDIGFALRLKMLNKPLDMLYDNLSNDWKSFINNEWNRIIKNKPIFQRILP